MKLNLTLSHLEHGPHLEELLGSKFSVQLEKLLKKQPDQEVFLHIERNHNGEHIVSSHTDLPGPGGHINAKHTDLDLVVCLKKVTSQLSKQILRFKNK